MTCKARRMKTQINAPATDGANGIRRCPPCAAWLFSQPSLAAVAWMVEKMASRMANGSAPHTPVQEEGDRENIDIAAAHPAEAIDHKHCQKHQGSETYCPTSNHSSGRQAMRKGQTGLPRPAPIRCGSCIRAGRSTPPAAILRLLLSAQSRTSSGEAASNFLSHQAQIKQLRDGERYQASAQISRHHIKARPRKNCNINQRGLRRALTRALPGQDEKRREGDA